MDNREKDLLMLRAAEHVKHSEYDMAVRVIDQILSKEPHDHLALFNKASTLRTAGQTDDAEYLLKRLLNLKSQVSGPYHQLGLISQEKGELESALTYFTKATEIQPLSADSWFERGMVLYDLERFKEAEEIFRHASVFDPDNPGVWDQIALCCQKQGNYEEAIRCYDHALELNRHAVQIYFHKAALLEQMGDRHQEMRCYDSIILIDPENIFSWLKKGLALMLCGEYELSLRYLSVAVRHENPGYMPYLLKGLVLAILNRNDEAVICFKEAHILAPGDCEISLHLGKALGSCMRTDEALDAFENVLTIKPKHREALEGKARALYHLNRWAELFDFCSQNRSIDPKNSIWYLLEARARGWQTDEKEIALNVILQGLSVLPHDESLLCLHSDLLVAINLTDDALDLLAHELIEESTVVSIMYRFATLHAKKENYQIASDYFDQIYKIRPEESQVLYLAGEAYERMGNLETALERYTSAICEDPMDSLVWLVRGRVLLNMGEAEDALLSLKQATSLSDEWFDAWMLQGKIEIELGYLDEARKSLTYATVLIPDESESWRLLGDVLHNLKDINPSRIAYERALAIDFSDHEARRGKINAHLSAAEIEEALGEYDIALSLKGENFWDLYGKAMVLFDANRVQEGEIILERAEAFVSEDPKVLFCLAGGWGAICEFERAESFYAASCELDPENSKVWCLRGHSLRDAGKFDEAVVCFNRALEIDPEDSESHSGKEICMDILEGRTLPYTCQRPDHDKNINTNSDQQLKEME